jgi:hypothetical protein
LHLVIPSLPVWNGTLSWVGYFAAFHFLLEIYKERVWFWVAICSDLFVQCTAQRVPNSIVLSSLVYQIGELS